MTVSQNCEASTGWSGTVSPIIEANGNMTGDGTNTYEWDAENRLIKINYPGIGNDSQFVYDGFGKTGEILEYSASSLTITRRFSWC